MVVYICNPSNWRAEVGGSQVQNQPGVHREILSQKTNNNKKRYFFICQVFGYYFMYIVIQCSQQPYEEGKIIPIL
jgi:hypothetical protein